jgi:hypothetical protein
MEDFPRINVIYTSPLQNQLTEFFKYISTPEQLLIFRRCENEIILSSQASTKKKHIYP